jgi:hypothetical protein
MDTWQSAVDMNMGLNQTTSIIYTTLYTPKIYLQLCVCVCVWNWYDSI